MRVVITGASGMLGGALTAALTGRGDTVTGISRDPTQARALAGVDWRGWGEIEGAVEGAGAVVHLAGAGVADKRWSASRKQELRDSRIGTGRRVVEAIRGAEAKPAVLVTISASGYYGSRGDDVLGEEEPPGDDFLARLCVDWEAAAADAGVRTVILRMGVVLAREGGALTKMLLPFKLGLGGPVGRGRQYLPWIHRDDAVGILLLAIDGEEVAGAINVVAPQAVTNAELSKTLARVLRRPALLRVPPVLLRLRLGEGAGVVTSSQRASAERIVGLGYAFRHAEMEEALRDLLH